MKKVATFFLLFFIICNLPLNGQKLDLQSKIRLNQVGYYPDAPKFFILADNLSRSYEIKDSAGQIVFSGKLMPLQKWDKSGEDVQIGEFSNLTKPGKYQIVTDNRITSYLFSIKRNLYTDIAVASVKAYYYQRMSIPMDAGCAGQYKRNMGHPDTICYYHPSTGYNKGFKASPKGWYDAGDYNKYVVNAGITLAYLLKVAELYPNWLPDRSLNIPESGNGKNDLLDEIKFELDWLITMQDTDGGVFFKLTNLNFDPFEMPEKTVEKRFFVGKSTTSSLCYSAILAQASRVYRNYDQMYSSMLLQMAEKSWKWALNYPDIEFRNPVDVKTGEYGDNDLKGEFFLAASELYISTGLEMYKDQVMKFKTPFAFKEGDNWRSFLPEIAYFSLVEDRSHLTNTEKKLLKNEIIKVADSLELKLISIPYRIPVDYFTWGSNSDIMDAAAIFCYAYKLTKAKKYLALALETTDYVFGKNATGYSFVTGYGSKPPLHPHHRLSEADGIIDPIPGFLVGGPNNDRPDEGNLPVGMIYVFKEPARSYLDETPSYASNEVAINWNAPLAFVLCFLENEVNK